MPADGTARAGRWRIGALALVAVAGALLLGLTAQCASPRDDVPAWAVPHAVSVQADLDGDGADDQLSLADGRLEVRGSDGARYRSPREWTVTDAFVQDVDLDGRAELVLGVWKRGSYGPSHPFWIEPDADEMTQHVFVMRYEAGDLVGVWMSSSVGEDLREMWFDEGGWLHCVDGAGVESLWGWDHWGFKLVEESVESADEPSVSAVSDDGGGSEESDGPVSFLAVGDNIMHAGIYERAYDADSGAYDFTPVYAHVSERVSSYDLSAVCQETILVEERSAVSDFPDFGTPLEAGDALVEAGFDIIASATNHANDKGKGGLDDTLAFWKRHHPGVTVLGLHGSAAEGPVSVVEARGMRFALTDCTYGLNGHELPVGQEWRIDTLDDLDRIAAGIGDAEDDVDATICFLHIGEEYAGEPTDEQRRVVEQLVDAGADVVICSHPHIVQPVEEVTNAAGSRAVVYWSLGNFASSQTEPGADRGGAASIMFARGDDGKVAVASFELLPLVCRHAEDGAAVYFN